MTLSQELRAGIDRALRMNRPSVCGRVQSLVGISVVAAGLRGSVGEVCTIRTAERGGVLAEIVGFRGEDAVLMPLDDRRGIAPHDVVESLGQPLTVQTGRGLCGRVLDGLGRPIDGGPPIRGPSRALTGAAPHALTRHPIDRPVGTGVAAIDGFATCGRGQRIGIFSGSGVGKSTLLGMVARNGSSDVNVIALVGERGREVNDFLEDVLGPEGLAKSVVIVATSDSPPMVRYKAPFAAVAIAESFREQGLDVLFVMDSVTRFAGAAREIGLAAGEPPTLRGYPPSLFALLPQLIERLGNDDRGSITGMFTVLVDGDDLNEPVSDALRGYLDGHIVLSRAIAARGRFPAVDVLASVSRLMPKICSKQHLEAATRVRELLAHHEEYRDLVQVGAYRQGSDALLDLALSKMSRIEALLYHGSDTCPVEQTLAELAELAGDSISTHGMVDT